jgi:hypothetical protein
MVGKVSSKLSMTTGDCRNARLIGMLVPGVGEKSLSALRHWPSSTVSTW